MEIIRVGLEDKVDVSIYTKSEFKAEQMNQIRLGLKHGIDVTPYLNPGIKWEEMGRNGKNT